MKNFLAITGLLFALMANPAFADTLVNVPHPTAVWDSTTGKAYALGVPGQGQTGLTILPSAATNNTWSGTNNFTGTFQIGGTTETFPTSGLLVGTTDTQALTNKTVNGVTIPSVTDTAALLGTNQAFTATETFSGSVALTGTVATQGQVFTTVQAGNPLMQDTVQNIPVASVNQAGGQVLIQSVSGRTIYPSAGLTLLVSGTAATATSEKIVCLPSGRLVATFNIAQLVNSIPVGPMSASVVAGPALNEGCQINDDLVLSNVGSNLATTTNLFPNIPYVMQ